MDVQKHLRVGRTAARASWLHVGHHTVARLLREAGYSLQAPRKTVEGAQHPDRNEQFEHINAKAEACLAEGILGLIRSRGQC